MVYIDLTENALILWNTDPESTLPFSSQYIINDRPGLWSYTALTGVARLEYTSIKSVVVLIIFENGYLRKQMPNMLLSH
mgnify:CR=1 FL=1